MRRAILVLLFLVLALFVGVEQTRAERRVALVIGNGAYQNATPLPNPKNDANAVAAALKRSGFHILKGLDLNKTGMEDMTIRFAREAREADIALFYYSGHAMQFAGVNYLMPIDARLKDEADLRRMARVDEIISDLQQAKNLRILVLDACRDNPLAEQLRRTIGLSRAASLQRGLAPIASPQGMIVAFSTQAGRTADDGKGRNSPYTAAFLRHIEKKDEIGSVFRRISDDVYEATNRSQLPELSLSLIGRFYLRGKPKSTKHDPGRTLPPSQAERTWQNIKETKSPEVLREFLKQHPEGLYAALARARLNELTEKKIASLQDPLTTSTDIVLELQQALKAAKCYIGKIDGNWGPNSKSALRRFAKTVDDAISNDASTTSLEFVRRHSGTVCPGQSDKQKITKSGKKSAENGRSEWCVAALPAYRKAMANKEWHPQSEAAKYVRQRCGVKWALSH